MDAIDIDPILSGQNLNKGLRKFYEDHWPQFCDIHIKCQNDVLVPAYKMLLHVSSGYFQAFFRQQPDSQLVNLPEFDSRIVTLAIKSIINPDLNEIEGDVMDLVKVADYLQMEDLLMIGCYVVARKMSKDNILEVIDLIHTVQVPALAEALTNFLQNNIQSVFAIQAISKLPEEHFNSVFMPNPGLTLYDSYGRRYDGTETLVILTNAYYEVLKSLDKLDSFNYIGQYTKCLDQGGDTLERKHLLWMLQWIFQTDFDTAESRLRNLRPGLCSVPLHREVYDLMKKQLDEADDVPRMPREYDDDAPNVVLGHRQVQDLHKIYGHHPIGSFQGQITRWSFEGNIRKINVKSRTWDGRHIVQGIQVFLDDGTSQAFGMDPDDTQRVTCLVVPDGQHIKTMNFRSGWFIDAIGFETNKGQVVGLEGGTGGDLETRTDRSLRGLHHFLRGLSGFTVMSQDAPCICHIELCFDVIDQSLSLAHEINFSDHSFAHYVESDSD